MLHQLICENQNLNLAIIIIALRTLKYEDSSSFKGKDLISTSTTAYYVVSKELANQLIKFNLFYSSDNKNENQISFVLQDRTPDIIRRELKNGHVKFQSSSEQLENDIKAIFGKYGGAMPVYMFTCDQASGDIADIKTNIGIKQEMYGSWNGKNIPQNIDKISARSVINSVDKLQSYGELDLQLPPDDNPEKCIVFNNDSEKFENRFTNKLKNDFSIAFKATFPQYSDVLEVLCYYEYEKIILTFDIDGFVSDSDKNNILQFAAEFGCSEPEVFDEPSMDYEHFRVYFYYNKDIKSENLINENIKKPAHIILDITGEYICESYIGCIKEMDDLSSFDGEKLLRAFTVKKHNKAISFNEAKKVLTAGSYIIHEGNTFKIKKVGLNNNSLVVKTNRVLNSKQSIHNFPVDLVERLNGICHLPRRDEEMFRSWNSRIGNFKSYKVLGESYWCDEPAFGEPCECVKILITK